MNDIVVAKLDTARQALMEARNIQDTKQVLDIAEAAEIYAKRQKLGEEAIAYAIEIKAEALRQLGRMLKEMQKAPGGQPYKSSTGTKTEPVEKTPNEEEQVSTPTKVEGVGKVPTLAEIGIDKKVSSLSQKIANLSEEDFEKVKAGASVAKIIKEREQEIKRSAITENIKPMEMPEGVYNVILSDPPWRYEFSQSESRAIENQYPTMSLEEIKALKVPTMDDAILFLWATAPKLQEGLEVLNAWGFTYKTCAVWDKEIIGMGYWFRSQHELLLVGIKGKFRTPDPQNRYSSVIREHRKGHSEKPEVVYDMIEKMFPDGQYLEIFARQRYNEKWTVWGNQL